MSLFKLPLLNSNLSLYVVNTELLNSYTCSAENYYRILQEKIPDAYDQLNFSMTVCDIWIALNTYSQQIIFDDKKSMNFPLASLQLKLFEENTPIENYLANDHLSPDEQFIFAYFLSTESMLWIHDIMEQEQRLDLINYYQQNLCYVDLFQLQDDFILAAEINNQTLFVKAMMKNLRETNEFNFVVQRAISKTKAFLSALISQ